MPVRLLLAVETPAKSIWPFPSISIVKVDQDPPGTKTVAAWEMAVAAKNKFLNEGGIRYRSFGN
jgi:hypothetical protein